MICVALAEQRPSFGIKAIEAKCEQKQLLQSKFETFGSVLILARLTTDNSSNFFLSKNGGVYAGSVALHSCAKRKTPARTS
jgi:hypothetical protein